MSDPAAGEAGAVDATAATPHAAEPSLEAGSDAPSIAPDHEAPKPDADAPRIVVPKAEAARPDADRKAEPKIEPKLESKPEPKPGKLIVMAPSSGNWDREDFAPHVKAEAKEGAGKRRLSAMAAVIALAAIVGAVSGALATAGVMHFAASQPPVQVADNSPLEASVARIDADVVALKAGLDHAAKTGVSQFNKTNDRLDKIEKAQAEPAAKLAKLSEAVEKLRAAPPVAATQAAAAAKETTGSIAPTQVATAAPAAPAQPAAAAKGEVGRLPTVEGWRLRDVANGGALIEGRSGLYEVYAGDPVPGLGRVDAIRRQDGRWVVVTSKGLVVAR